VKKHLLRHSAIEKIKCSDNHRFVAFTVNIGNDEVLSGGIKDIETQTVMDLKLEQIS